MASLVSTQHPRRSILQMCWARRNYQRLGSPSRNRLGSGGRRPAARRRLARLRVLLLLSPGRLLAKLRDAYVDAMLALAGGAAGRPCSALASKAEGGGALWAKRVPRARSVARSGDFERRMMEHLYSTLVVVRAYTMFTEAHIIK